jgi:effector-binding domain-containing protein
MLPVNPTIALLEMPMSVETVVAKAQPMLYVKRSSKMDPQAISGAMGEAFHAVGSFIGGVGITPAGPPLAIYRKWGDGNLDFEVGFPVDPKDLAKATKDVRAGETPSGPAAKLIHIGPYDTLRKGYEELERYLADKGLPQPSVTWDVYLDDPDRTPVTALRTELYMALPPSS